MSKLVYLLLMIFFLNPAWANTHYHQHPVSPLANALRTGTDTNGNALYLCRAKLFNSIQPGKHGQDMVDATYLMVVKNTFLASLPYRIKMNLGDTAGNPT
ncbi:hypothetical protein PGH43_14055 [Legionella pneumophila 130b]|nr:hypothetical protein PGH43_14055 [Legionella pneumophila 130b]